MVLKERRGVMKLLSLFSGIGAFEKALENIGIDYELVNYCEIDKYASKSYSLIHNVPESVNLKDVSKVDTSKLPNDIDLITYGFPCQDISIAGKKKGFKDDEGNITRSGLFFEALRIIKSTKPRVAIAENVKALTGNKLKNEFRTVLDSLADAGYNQYWQVLNSKDYGIPQGRERVFIVSIRKDIDKTTFKFPDPIVLTKTIDDFLEENVDKKYYLSEKMEKYILGNALGGKTHDYYDRSKAIFNKKVAYTLTTEQNKRAGTTNYIADGYSGELRVSEYLKKKYDRQIRLRKLTEKESFRLMGFDDKDCDILRNNGISMTQLYKQAGNSIVVNVLQEVFKSLYELK